MRSQFKNYKVDQVYICTYYEIGKLNAFEKKKGRKSITKEQQTIPNIQESWGKNN